MNSLKEVELNINNFTFEDLLQFNKVNNKIKEQKKIHLFLKIFPNIEEFSISISLKKGGIPIIIKENKECKVNNI